MGLQGLDYGLRAKLREYFHQTKHLRVAHAHRRLISQMSPTLQSRITLMCNERWLRRVQFLDGAEEGFIIQLAIQLTAMVFAPGELAPTGYLYVVHRGIALYGGRVLTGGKVWGDDMILLNASLRRPWCARAMNYLEVFLISRDEMLNTAYSFPRTRRLIRRAALLLALRRYLIALIKPSLGNAGDQLGSAFLRASDASLEEQSTMLVQQAIVSHTHTNQKLLEADLSEVPPPDDDVGGGGGGGYDGGDGGEIASMKADIALMKQQLQRLCDALIKE